MSASSRAVAAGLTEPGEALFRLMAEQWPGAVLVLDRELRVLWANPVACRLVGHERGPLHRLRWAELRLPWELGAEQLRALLGGERLKLQAALLTDGDGTQRPYAAQLVPLADGHDHVTAILCVIDESAPPPQIGVWQWDFQTGLCSVDERWCSAMGIDPCPGPDHLERWLRAIHPDDVAELIRARDAIREGRIDRFEVEYRIRAGQARWMWVLQRGEVTERLADGQVRRVRGFCIEIDAHKRAQVALQENEARLATALWGARSAFWQWHVATDVTVMSPLWFAMTGYTREQWESIPDPWLSRIHPEERDHVAQELRRHLSGQSPSFEVEYRIRTASGEWKWILTRGRAIEWDFDGNAVLAVGVSLDIDAHKRAERELRSSETRLETAVWGAGIGLWEMDFRSGTTRWFSDWCDRLGLDPCEGRDHDKRWQANIHPDDLAATVRRYDDHLAGATDSYDAEYRIRDRKGRWRWLFERGRVVERASDGSALRMVGVCMDIDERKDAELESLRAQRRLEIALASARGGMWDWDLVTGQARHTEFFYRMLGVPPQQSVQDNTFWRSRVHPDDLPWVEDELRRLIDGRSELYQAEYRMQHADGSWRWVHDRGRIAERDDTGRATRIVGFLVDVTARKLAQEAVQKSEALLRAVTEHTPDWLFLIDDRLVVRFANRGFGQLRAGELVGRSLLELASEANRESLEKLYRQVLSTAQPASMELSYEDRNGSLRHYQHRVAPVMEDGTVRSLIVVVTDVTERKRAEIALLESQTTLQTVAASSADWLALFDRDSRCVFLNRAFRGRSPAEWVGATVEEFAPPADRARMRAIFEHVMKTGLPRDFDQVYVDPEFGTRYLELRARAVQTDGRIFGAVVNISDVTERYKQQDVMRTQARILETMREGVVLVEAASGIIKLTNSTFDAMFGYRRGELLGASVEPLLAIPPAQRRRLERSLKERSDSWETPPVEFECQRSDGSRFVAACVITPLSIGGAKHWLAVINDVTERKRLEREIIEVANREQQRIGSDLHDGLGQDLTGIALMLRGVAAQLRKEGSAARLDVEDVIGLVNNAIDSTRSLARGLSPVSAERGGLPAALQALAARASSRYSERYGVRVTFHADIDGPLRLSEAAATHLYRIAQEALTNVIRHSRATEVSIRLEVSGEELQLRIDDNGRGFGSQSPDASGGLGLKIMRYRAQMLGGDLVLETSPEGGASVRCSCPLELIAATERNRPMRANPAAH